MNPDPFANLIKTSQRGQPHASSNAPASNQESDPFTNLIKTPSPEQLEANTPYQKKAGDYGWWEKNFTTEGRQAQASKNRNFAKSILSGASAGFSEYFDPLKVDNEEEGSSIGQLTGALLPIGLTYKGLDLGFKVLKNLYSFGSKAKFGLELAHQAATGAIYGTEKQLAKVTQGKEFDPAAPIEEAAEFAAFGALLHGLVKYTPPAKEWLKSLTSNQAESLAKGILPENLTVDQYKFWQDELAPDWLKKTENNYEKAVVDANKKADAKFEQDNSIAKAKHEKDLYEAAQSNNMSKEKYEQSVKEYERDLQRNMDEHEAKVEEIQRENQEAIQDFEEAQQSFQQLRTRQAAVENSTQLRPGEENQPYRAAPNNQENPSLENEVGNIISPNEAVNSTNAGRANIEAVRANDAVDYQAVNQAYTRSEELSSQVSSIHQNLVSQLETTARELSEIPHLSAPEAQRLRAVNDILDRLRTVDEAGNVTGFLEVPNQLLHDQAKSLRYVMDFTFEHGNTKGIFGQTVRQLEEAAEFAARATGNIEAAEANVEARRLYREWAQDYNNDYMRPYRDTGNQDYSGMFKRAANSTDEFNALNNILSRSNAGQQLSSVTRRAAVETRLGKFLENPHAANGKEFELALRELGAVISPEEATAIRGVFQRGRNQPELVKKRPQPPKLKELPKEKLPEFNKSKSEKNITSAEIANRKFEETPEMKIASKEMKMSPEQIRKLADSPSGIKKIKENTSPDIFKKMGQQRAKEILYGKQVKGKITGKSGFKAMNEGDNFSIMAEILGENEAMELLEGLELIADREFTKDNLIKYGKKAALVKSLVLFGIL